MRVKLMCWHLREDNEIEGKSLNLGRLKRSLSLCLNKAKLAPKIMQAPSRSLSKRSLVTIVQTLINRVRAGDQLTKGTQSAITTQYLKWMKNRMWGWSRAVSSLMRITRRTRYWETSRLLRKKDRADMTKRARNCSWTRCLNSYPVEMLNGNR